MSEDDEDQLECDGGDDGEEECSHPDWSFDILTGRATCYCCGESWYPKRRPIIDDFVP